MMLKARGFKWRDPPTQSAFQCSLYFAISQLPSYWPKQEQTFDQNLRFHEKASTQFATRPTRSQVRVQQDMLRERRMENITRGEDRFIPRSAANCHAMNLAAIVHIPMSRQRKTSLAQFQTHTLNT